MSVEINEEALHYQYTAPDGFVAAIMERAALHVETTAKVLMLIPGSGRTYGPGNYFLVRHGKVYHWVRFSEHTASAPGEPASSDTGRAMNSIGHTMDYGGEAVSATVHMNVNYSIYIEMGTRYMAPRPTLRPALSSLAGADLS